MFNRLYVVLLPAVLLLACAMAGCQSGDTNDDASTNNVATLSDTVRSRPDTVSHKVFSNERFKNVRVQRVDENTFRITGEAQVFEAAFSWSLEDGHYELKQGHEMTDAGAPAWGRFGFSIDADKKDPDTTLTLVLFESSPKDGSRQHELPLPLY
jgi:hypothetical protein